MVFPNTWFNKIVYRGVGEVRSDNLREGTNGNNIRDWNFFTNSRSRADDYGTNITAAILNLDNLDNGVSIDYKSNTTFLNNNSAFVAEQGGDEYVVRTKEQIHILGNAKDIEGFKNFKNKKNESTKEISDNKSVLGGVSKKGNENQGGQDSEQLRKSKEVALKALDLEFISENKLPKETVNAVNKSGDVIGEKKVPNEKMLMQQKKIQEKLDALKKFVECLTN